MLKCGSVFKMLNCQVIVNAIKFIVISPYRFSNISRSGRYLRDPKRMQVVESEKTWNKLLLTPAW